MRAFQLEGADVRWPYRVRLGGGEEVEQVDGVVYTDGLNCLVESKDQDTRVNFEPIAKVRNQLLRRPGLAIGIVFSRSGFTDPALSLGQFTAPQTILLWQGDEIHYAVRRGGMRRGLVAKFQRCVEEGLSYYNIIIEDMP